MNYPQPVARDPSTCPPACLPGCRHGACPLCRVQHGPTTGSCHVHHVQPGFPMSLQPHRVQDPGRTEACPGTGRVSLPKVGTHTFPCSALDAPRYSIQLSPCRTRPCPWVPAAMGLNTCPQWCWLMCAPMLTPAWVSSVAGNCLCVSLHPMLLWSRTDAGWSLLSRHLSHPGYTLPTRNVVSQDSFPAVSRISRPGGNSAGMSPAADTLGLGSQAGARTPGSQARLGQRRHPFSMTLQGGGNGRDLLSSALQYPLFAGGILIHLPLSGTGAEGTKACHYLAQGSLPVPRASPLPR